MNPVWEDDVGMMKGMYMGFRFGFKPIVWLLVAGSVAWGAGELRGQENGSLLERTAGLDVEDVTLGEALEELQRSSGVAIGFSPDVVPLERTVRCDCEDRSVGEALAILLEGTGLSVRSTRTQILIGRPDGAAEVSGRITDAVTGRGVSPAEIRIIGTDLGTLSGPDGGFQVRGVPSGSRAVQISAFGYQTETLSIDVVGGIGASINASLNQAPIPLSELVITPGSYGILDSSPASTGIALTRHDIEATPQIGDDVFRTLKRMPGVSTDDISARLNVRGSTDRDLLVRLDGVELFEPYHLRDLDGALGIVDVQTLGGVDLITGGFPVEYGDKTAGVFNMRTRAAPSEGTRTTIGASLSTASVSSQGNFAGGRGQWLTSLRRGFLEYLLSAAGVEDEINPRYWDALGRVQYLATDNHLIAAEVLLAGDQMGWTDDESGSRIDSDWSNGYAWLTWDASFGDRVRASSVLSGGGLTRDRRGSTSNPNRGAFTPLEATVSDVADFTFLALRQDWQVDLNSDLLLKLGAEGRWNEGTYEYRNQQSRFALDESEQLIVQDDSLVVSAAPDGTELGVYLALRGRTFGAFSWEAGVRYDRWSYLDADGLAPRLLTRLELGDRSNLRASVGRYYQSQGLHELDAADGDVTFSEPERVDQLAVGVERVLREGLTLRLDGYAKSIHDPRPFWVNLSREVNPLFEVESDRREVAPDESRARGLEAILTRDGTAGPSWSLSYALSQAEDRVDGRWAPRTLDQTHAVNLRWAIPLGSDWQISGSWQYHTGWPFTEQFLDVVTADLGDGNESVQVLRRGFGDLNAQRLPAYHRLDMRTTRTFQFERSTLEVFLDVFNFYDRTNLRGYEWFLQDRGGVLNAMRDGGEEQLPRLPTLGMRWVF